MSDEKKCSNEYKYESDVCFSFSMPYNQVMKIIRLSTFEIDDESDDYDNRDAEIEGIIYTLQWNGESLPWHAKTHREAVLIAMGCQWGAQQMFNMRYSKDGQ